MKKLFLLPIALLLHSTLFAQLFPGDIMFVGFNADGTDGYQIVALVEIPANTTIFFTDNEWNGSAFVDGNESYWEWSSTANIPAGTVLTFQNINAGSYGSQMTANTKCLTVNIGTTCWVYDGTSNDAGAFKVDDETVYAYLGSDINTPTTFLTAFSNNAFAGCSFGGLASVLTAGANAVSLSGAPDVAVFDNDGINDTSVSYICDGSNIAACAADIANPANWQTDDGTFNQDNDGIHPDFPLVISFFPIELVSFEGRIQENGILLEWITASESNNDYMAVERSATGRDFVELGRIAGQGTSFELNRYAFLDKNPMPGLNYYRLRQVDFDGRKEYHKVIALDYSGATKGQTAFLFPSQVAQTATLQLPHTSDQEIEARVYNLMGQVVARFRIPAGTDAYDLDLAALSTGQYAVMLMMGQQPEVLRFNKH